MHAKLRKMIETEAKSDAALFVEEFAEVLDPAVTDWDAVAWDLGDSYRAAEDAENSSEGWEFYQKTLIAETKRLVAMARMSP